YHGIAGVAKIFVDGEEVGEAAFSGKTPANAQSIIVGNPWGASFNGELRGIEIRSDPPSPNAPPARHTDLMQGESFTVDYQPAPDPTEPAKPDNGPDAAPDASAAALLDIRFTAEGPIDASSSDALIVLKGGVLAAEAGA
ncbi:MAG: hypothetical protein RIM80_23585, partial [Alphaproteobacteria bacterium]